MYQFLSDAFLEELAERDLRRLADGASGSGLPELPEEVRKIAETTDPFAGSEAFREFGESIRDLDADEREAVVTDLATEYSSLFLMGTDDQVNPYESYYLGDEPIISQEPTVEVKHIMDELGYGGHESYAEPADHVGVELAFMAFLCRAAAKQLDDGNREYARRYLALQRQFLDQHLLEWVPDLCDDLAAATDATFYVGLADVTEAFLRSEADAIEHQMAVIAEVTA